MLSIFMVCLSKSESQHIATRPLAPTSSLFLATKVVRVDDLVQGEEAVIVQGGRERAVLSLLASMFGGRSKYGALGSGSEIPEPVYRVVKIRTILFSLRSI
jgi:hypothetical protein